MIFDLLVDPKQKKMGEGGRVGLTWRGFLDITLMRVK